MCIILIFFGGKAGSVAGRQRGGREIMRDNKGNSEITTTKKTGFEGCQVAPGLRPEKGHLTPEVKIANEIICDHVRDKLYPHFCNLF
jgi:hypothetical protein